MSSAFSRRTRALVGSALTVTAVAAAVFAAAPASAATLPSDESIITIGWNGILSKSDAVTGVSTPISDTGVGAIAGLDIDKAGRGYAVDFADLSVLYTADLVAGALSNPIDITIDGETNVARCTGLDYEDASGVIIAACDQPDYSVGTIDPARRLHDRDDVQ
jgi:hypothetical protein